MNEIKKFLNRMDKVHDIIDVPKLIQTIKEKNEQVTYEIESANGSEYMLDYEKEAAKVLEYLSYYLES